MSDYTPTPVIWRELRDQILTEEGYSTRRDLEGTPYNSLITLKPDHDCGPWCYIAEHEFRFRTRPPFVWAGGHRA